MEDDKPKYLKWKSICETNDGQLLSLEDQPEKETDETEQNLENTSLENLQSHTYQLTNTDADINNNTSLIPHKIASVLTRRNVRSQKAHCVKFKESNNVIHFYQSEQSIERRLVSHKERINNEEITSDEYHSSKRNPMVSQGNINSTDSAVKLKLQSLSMNNFLSGDTPDYDDESNKPLFRIRVKWVSPDQNDLSSQDQSNNDKTTDALKSCLKESSEYYRLVADSNIDDTSNVSAIKSKTDNSTPEKYQKKVEDDLPMRHNVISNKDSCNTGRTFDKSMGNATENGDTSTPAKNNEKGESKFINKRKMKNKQMKPPEIPIPEPDISSSPITTPEDSEDEDLQLKFNQTSNNSPHHYSNYRYYNGSSYRDYQDPLSRTDYLYRSQPYEPANSDRYFDMHYRKSPRRFQLRPEVESFKYDNSSLHQYYPVTSYQMNRLSSPSRCLRHEQPYHKLQPQHHHHHPHHHSHQPQTICQQIGRSNFGNQDIQSQQIQQHKTMCHSHNLGHSPQFSQNQMEQQLMNGHSRGDSNACLAHKPVDMNQTAQLTQEKINQHLAQCHSHGQMNTDPHKDKHDQMRQHLQKCHGQQYQQMNSPDPHILHQSKLGSPNFHQHHHHQQQQQQHHEPHRNLQMHACDPIIPNFSNPQVIDPMHVHPPSYHMSSPCRMGSPIRNGPHCHSVSPNPYQTRPTYVQQPFSPHRGTMESNHYRSYLCRTDPNVLNEMATQVDNFTNMLKANAVKIKALEETIRRSRSHYPTRRRQQIHRSPYYETPPPAQYHQPPVTVFPSSPVLTRRPVYYN